MASHVKYAEQRPGTQVAVAFSVQKSVLSATGAITPKPRKEAAAYGGWRTLRPHGNTDANGNKLIRKRQKRVRAAIIMPIPTP